MTVIYKLESSNKSIVTTIHNVVQVYITKKRYFINCVGNKQFIPFDKVVEFNIYDYD